MLIAHRVYNQRSIELHFNMQPRDVSVRFNTIGMLLYHATGLIVFKSQLINGQRWNDLRNSNTSKLSDLHCDYAMKRKKKTMQYLRRRINNYATPVH